MSERPTLKTDMDVETFRSYYYLKEELIAFCRSNDLSTSGSKINITDRITHYLDTGEKLSSQHISKAKPDIGLIEDDTLIEPNFVCSEKHRAFFKGRIGKGFSFNVAFQKWLKENTGRTYGQAIEAYCTIMEEKKHGKTTIDRQFEYNTYIRDFFTDNQGHDLGDAIKCWKYKKGLRGHNRYEKADLVILNTQHK